jgi:hypothetical protein
MKLCPEASEVYNISSLTNFIVNAHLTLRSFTSKRHTRPEMNCTLGCGIRTVLLNSSAQNSATFLDSQYTFQSHEMWGWREKILMFRQVHHKLWAPDGACIS